MRKAGCPSAWAAWSDACATASSAPRPRSPLERLPQRAFSPGGGWSIRKAMKNRPSVLVLDDGELHHVHHMLWELGINAKRLLGREIGPWVQTPRDLLISAGRRTLVDMPELIDPGDSAHPPQWICVHNQDYLPMRQRLRELGVHYLVHSAIDEESLRRFLMQLVRSGAEQRSSLRLPLGGEVRFRIDGATESCGLVEISPDGCRILTREAFDPGARLTVLLPSSLGGGAVLELSGFVVRDAGRAVRGGRDLHEIAIRFDEFDEATLGRIRSIYRGERIGTRITPLAGLGEEPDREEAAPEASGERREEARRIYDRPVRVLGCEPADGNAVLGCDLSLAGVRLTGCPSLEVGAQVTVALYGAAREEPIVVRATVSRSSEDGEAALAFDALPADRRQSIEKLLRAQPLLDALQQPDPDAGRTLVAELYPESATHSSA
jgi:hypothetical protein